MAGYDYVIVGAGSAGCVLASRLTEDPGVSVLLLEAGGSDDRPEVRVPAGFPRLFKSECDWAYYTESQPEVGGRRLYWPRGRLLGGSSSINAMIYIRGNPRDYDRWRALGNEGWGYSDVLPVFRLSENQERGADEYHGVGGPLNVEDARYANPLSRTFVEAGAQYGLPRNEDFNGAGQAGVGLYQVTQRRGRRWSVADAYLKPVLARPNLSVRTGALARRVVFEGDRAAGVEYVSGGETQVARAGREVVLCGGTINSPQLLMLSGVGAAGDLEALGIPVVADVPGVGKNLQDHPAVAVVYECRRPVSLINTERRWNLMRYLLFRRGPLATCVAEAGGFVRTDLVRDTPDIQFHFAPNYYVEHGFGNPPGHGFTFGPTLLHPESRGEIRLRSDDPDEPPAIRANYLTAERDLRTLVQSIRLARELARMRAFDPYRGREVYPGPEVESDEELAAYVRNSFQTLYHPAGTCRMGPDSMAVVDAELRVRGVEGLRVADASVMPEVVGGNTNAPTVMIAEKAAAAMRGSEAGDYSVSLRRS